MSAVDYASLIPNNVDLASDRALQRALEAWHPKFLDWWRGMGPDGFQDVRSVPAHRGQRRTRGLGEVRLREDAAIPLGHSAGAGRARSHASASARTKANRCGRKCPGEYRALLRRLMVIQGDTEPASVEQQRHLGKTAPSLYDLRNLFQVNVEEGRHLWAMVYLLQRYFGRDGREEAEMLLKRRSGNVDTPRILGAFNERTPDWLSFFMFTSFTDRDGKMQLEALAQSGFDPLSRTCRFMLTEEGHHMFVGKSGVERILRATCAAMNAQRHQRPARRRRGAPARRHRSADDSEEDQLPLLGNARSVRLGNLDERSQRVQRRHQRTLPRRPDRRRPSVARARRIACCNRSTAASTGSTRPRSSAINARLRDDYIDDCEPVLRAWNRVDRRCRHRLRTAASAPRVPSQGRRLLRTVGHADRRHRRRGALAERRDRVVADANRDLEYVSSLMQPCHAVGRVRAVDRAADQRRRRQTRRLRVRAAGVVTPRERPSRPTTRPTRCCCRISATGADHASR